MEEKPVDTKSFRYHKYWPRLGWTPMNARYLLLAVTLLFAGCGEIENSARLVQKLDKPLVAGIGDKIIEIDTRESLPNIFGKADIFGRTRPTGRFFVTYLGLEQGRAVFERRNIGLQSNATTMNSSPTFIPQTSTTNYTGTTSVGGTMPGGTFSGSAMSSGTATTVAPPIVLPPSGSQTQVIANDRIRYYLDLSKDMKLFVGGNVILIEEVTASSVRYRIKKQN